MFSPEAKNRIRRKILKTRKKCVSSVLKIQELFYFANCIFYQNSTFLGEKGIKDFREFFDIYYKPTVEKITKAQGIKFKNFKYDPTNDGNKAKAEIIYTVLNEPSYEQSYKDTIEKIWNGPFLSAYKDSADQITKSRLRLNLIESTLTEDLAIYKTQGLQSALYEYLTPENSGLTQDELDMRKKLLIDVNTKDELKDFKNDTLASELRKQKDKLEKEGEINTDTLEGIFILAANNKINIPLEENDGLDSLISNYIKRIKLTNENSVKTLSDIIYTVLYPSVTYMSSKQDNSIIEALKTKLSEIKQEICKKGIECESYLFYTVHKIDKFIDCYESKKSKKQSSESAKPAEQEKISDSNFLTELINIKDNVDNNKVKAIITLIKYYQLKNASQGKPKTFEDQATTIESQDKNKNPKSNTNSKFEELIKDTIIPKILEKSNEESVDDLLKIETQHKIADREVDFCITFNKNCTIQIAKDFEIPIAKGTKIVIEADGTPHFEKAILPKNLKEAQDAITGKTMERNYEIKGAFIDNKDSLQERVSTLRGKEERLLECACYLQRFRQRRKHLDPTIHGESQPQKSPQYTKKAEQNSGLLEMTLELQELKNQLLCHKDIIPESIKKSKLFFSIPLLTSCMTEDKKYKEEEIQKVFLNCFINAYCSQALSNLKEFYRQKAEMEKNTPGTHGTLDSLYVVSNGQTNKKIGGIDALKKIRGARDEEKAAIKDYFPTPQNTRTSGEGNTLQ